MLKELLRGNTKHVAWYLSALHMGHDKALYRMLWDMVRMVSNLALGKKKTVQERPPGGADTRAKG